MTEIKNSQKEDDEFFESLDKELSAKKETKELFSNIKSGKTKVKQVDEVKGISELFGGKKKVKKVDETGESVDFLKDLMKGGDDEELTPEELKESDEAFDFFKGIMSSEEGKDSLLGDEESKDM